MLGLYYWHLRMCVLISATANLAKVESTFHVGGRLTFSFGFALWRLLFLHTCRQTTWWTQERKKTLKRAHAATLTHISTGRGFPLWKLVRIRAMVVRVFPWKTQTGSLAAESCLLTSQQCEDYCCERRGSNTLTHSLCDGISQAETHTAVSSLKLLVIKAKTTDHLATRQQSGSWWLYVWNLCGCDGVAHQSHVICQYSSTNPLRGFFGRETCEAVKEQLASLLPEGWQ